MSKLNIIIVWYNEEKNLTKCFKSIKNFNNNLDLNVIYCDQESSDNSVKIAKEFWIHVDNHPRYWVCETSRFRAVEEHIKDKNERILLLDADEEVTSKLSGEISECINTDCSDIWILPIDLYFMWKKTVTAMQPRLFKNWAVKLTCIPHNALIPISENKKIFKNKLINDDLKNNGQEINNRLEKLNRYTSDEVDKIWKVSKIKIFYGLFIKPIIWFFGFWIWWWYFFKGIPWWILAYYNSAYEFFKYAKIYEKSRIKK